MEEGIQDPYATNLSLLIMRVPVTGLKPFPPASASILTVTELFLQISVTGKTLQGNRLFRTSHLKTI